MKSIYIFSSGELKRKGNTLYFETEQGKKYVPVENTREILVFGEVSLNKKFLEFLSQKEIILHYFSHHGYYMGSFYPREHYNSGYMIIKQAEHYMDEEKRLELASSFVKGAKVNALRNLKYYQRRGAFLDDIVERIENLSIDNVGDINELMAIEGNIKQLYYSGFDRILKDEDFAFDKRTKRPPLNRLNTLISFVNSIIYVICLSEIYHTHLDPRIGFLHTSNFRRFSLNLDIAEIFKPVLGDRIIFSLINRGMIKSKDFEKKMSGLNLEDSGKKKVVKEIDNRLKDTIKHEKLGRNVSYRTLIRMEAYKIEKHLIGEEKYTPFIMRW